MVKQISEVFFAGKDDEWLGENSIIYHKIKNLDVIFMRIRRIQYHVGHCNSILRENRREAVEWLDYYGESYLKSVQGVIYSAMNISGGLYLPSRNQCASFLNRYTCLLRIWQR